MPQPENPGCKVCKRPLLLRPGERGRPPTYCPPKPGEDRSACARLDGRLGEVATLVRAILADVGTDSENARMYLQYVKSFLWKEANAATNRGRLVGMVGRKPYAKKRSGWWRVQGPQDSATE